MNELRTGLSYGDVLLVPQRSSVDSRSDVDLSTDLADREWETVGVDSTANASADADD